MKVNRRRERRFEIRVMVENMMLIRMRRAIDERLKNIGLKKVLDEEIWTFGFKEKD